MNQLIDIAKKDLRLLMRDKAGFILTFGLPLMLATLMGAIFSGITAPSAKKLEVVVVNRDDSEAAWEFIEVLNNISELSVQTLGYEEAVVMLEEGSSDAYIILEEGFGEASERQFTGAPTAVEIGLGTPYLAKGDVIQGLLTQYAAHQQNITPFKFTNVEVKAEQKGPRNAFDFAFPLGLMWGILSCTATFAISLVIEKSQGTLIRLQMAPISRFNVLAGKGLACFIVTVATSLVTFMLGILAFGIMVQSYLHLLMAILTTSLAFSGLMMFLAIFAKTQRAAAAIAWTTLQLLAWMGGGGFPLFAMPEWMQMVSYLSPVRYGILALEGATWRQYDLMQMLEPCGIMVVIGVAFFVIGTKMFKWAK